MRHFLKRPMLVVSILGIVTLACTEVPVADSEAPEEEWEVHPLPGTVLWESGREYGRHIEANVVVESFGPPQDPPVDEVFDIELDDCLYGGAGGQLPAPHRDAGRL